MNSLRARLFVALSLALLVALGAGGVLIFELSASALRAELDARLDANLLPAIESANESAGAPSARDEDAARRDADDRGAAAYAPEPDSDETPGSIAAILEQRLAAEFADAHSGIGFVAFAPDGRAVARSASLGALEVAPPPDFDGERLLYDVVLPKSHRRRALAVRMTAVGSDATPVGLEALPTPPTTFVLLASSSEMMHRLAKLRSLLLFAGGATWLLAAGFLQLALRRGLAPFSRFAAQVAEADPDTVGPSAGAAAAALPSELAPVAEKLDALITRLRAAVARERRFNSAVAHELRTPVAELRATTEVALGGGDDAAELRAALVDVEGSVRHLESIVQALLSLRSGQHLGEVPRLEAIALAGFVAEAVARAAPAAKARGIAVDMTVASDATVTSDAGRLRSVVDNLLSNAIEYAPPSSAVAISAAARDGRFEVTVRNARPDGLVDADVERFFEPFWSKAPRSAGGGTGHVGLGLFLARAFAAAIGGEVHARLVDGGAAVEVGLTASSTGAAVSAAPPSA